MVGQVLSFSVNEREQSIFLFSIRLITYQILSLTGALDCMIEQGNEQDRLLGIKCISVQMVAKWWRLYPLQGA